MSYCTEHTLLPERSVSPPRKRKRRAVTPKPEWPRVPPKHVRVFVLSDSSSTADFPKSEHLQCLRETCQSQDVDKVVIGPILNKKHEPTGRQLVVYSGLHENKSPNAYLAAYLPDLTLLGNVVLGAQSVKTGNLVSVKASDIDHLVEAARLGTEQQEALKEAATEAGGVIIQ